MSNPVINSSGFMHSQSTTRRGARCSSNKAFLRPVRHRKNLHISMRSFVHKVMINPGAKRAWGVKYAKKGKIRIVKARKEVILSAGGLMSAPILMHSGVGPKDHLQELGVIMSYTSRRIIIT